MQRVAVKKLHSAFALSSFTVSDYWDWALPRLKRHSKFFNIFFSSGFLTHNFLHSISENKKYLLER